MLDPVTDRIFAIRRAAFENVKGPIAPVLARNCTALFLDGSGRVTRIENIDAKDSGLGSRLGGKGQRGAVCELVDVPISVEDCRTMIMDCLMFARATVRDDENSWWVFSGPDPELCKPIEQATTLADLYKALRPETAHPMEVLP